MATETYNGGNQKKALGVASSMTCIEISMAKPVKRKYQREENNVNIKAASIMASMA